MPISILFKVARVLEWRLPKIKDAEQRKKRAERASVKFVEHREAHRKMLLILIKNFSSSAGAGACSHH
jgi:hypothetical protein